MLSASIRVDFWGGLIVLIPLWDFRRESIRQGDGWVIDVEELRHATMLEF